MSLRLAEAIRGPEVQLRGRCVSFAIMAELGLQQALAFDRHFVSAGFTLVPGV